METGKILAHHNGRITKTTPPAAFRPVTLGEVLAVANGANHAPWFIISVSNGRAYRVRRNGAIKTWKTRPYDVSIPLKVGFRECFRLTQDDIAAGRLLVECDGPSW